MRKSEVAPGGDRISLSVDEAAEIMGIGKSKTYELIRNRRLPARKIGSRTVILRQDLTAFLESLPFVRVPREAHRAS